MAESAAPVASAAPTAPAASAAPTAPAASAAPTAPAASAAPTAPAASAAPTAPAASAAPTAPAASAAPTAPAASAAPTAPAASAAPTAPAASAAPTAPAASAAPTAPAASAAPTAPAASTAPEASTPRQARKGPAPFASFDHDVSDESSPESKMAFQLPEIREEHASSPGRRAAPAAASAAPSPSLSPSPAAGPFPSPALPAPRIDISRASSSSHHDSRDSSPELALFAAEEEGDDDAGGAGRGAGGRLELAFREEGAADLRSSTEELAFLEPEPPPVPSPSPSPSTVPHSAPVPTAAVFGPRRHSRKDSQSSEAALLAISGRTSRLSSIGSQGSAHSAVSNFSHVSDYSHISKLSVVSGVSRSPSPHKMLLETSFCGPKPIETDPEMCVEAAESRLLQISNLVEDKPAAVPTQERCEMKTEATIENVSRRNVVDSTKERAQVLAGPVTDSCDKLQKELNNQIKLEEKKTKPVQDGRAKRKEQSATPEVYSSKNRTKDIIRIKLKPDHEYDDEEEDSERTLVQDSRQKPATLDLNDRSKKPAHFNEIIVPDPPLDIDKKLQTTNRISSEHSPGVSPTPSKKNPRKDPDSRTPSPAGVNVSRKSSFCSLFKSRETITSPDSPSAAHFRRKKSVNEGNSRSRSKSRDRSATPTSNNKIKGSVLSLFKTPKKGGTSPSLSSRDTSPVVHNVSSRQVVHRHVEIPSNSEKLKYYEDTRDGIIHIPLHTPPDEKLGSHGTTRATIESEANRPKVVEVIARREPLKTVYSANAEASIRTPIKKSSNKPIHRTVLPDGSIIIPLHSPTEKTNDGSSTYKPDILKNDDIVNVNSCDRTAETSSTETKTSTGDGTSSSESRSPAVREQTVSKKHIVFTTNIGSEELPFSTQFSITKTPSVTSEISEAFSSVPESVAPADCDVKREEIVLRDSHITTTEPSTGIGLAPTAKPTEGRGVERSVEAKSEDASRGTRTETEIVEPSLTYAIESKSNEELHADSSESELSSEIGPLRKDALRDLIAEGVPAEEVEKKSLVVTQESFEEELPYVPTTLPQERSLALPMVPVRERAAPPVCGVDRPRCAAPLLRAVAPPSGPSAPSAPTAPSAPSAAPSDPHHRDKLTIRLPRRASAAPSPAPAPAPAPAPWVNFEEVPERRKQPKRIQTVPREEAAAAGYSYVEPDECRCECHLAARDDELPLLRDRRTSDGFVSDSSLEYSCSEQTGAGAEEKLQLSLQIGTPFTCDLDVRSNRSSFAEQQE